MGFEFGESHLDRIEVGAVGRQEEEPRPALFEDGGGLFAFVAGEVVEDDHVASVQRRGELGFDPGFEDFPVHRAIDHPRRGEAILTQGGDEGLGAPMTKGSFHLQALPLACPASQPCHLRRGPGLIDKNQPFWALLHPGLAMARPHPPRPDNVSAFGFGRQQRFF